MRIRRKKHLGERLDKVKDVLLVADRDEVNVILANKDKKYFDFCTLFGNENPVNLEIGCGKAGFITECAKQNPNENYFAVELLENIIVMGAEKVKNEGVKNVRFFNCGADYLPRYIPEQSIKKIFLNFSPPYPGKAYENRRLTKKSLVEDYYSYLVPTGEILLKTDDWGFFEYSFERLVEKGFTVSDVSEKINSGELSNIQTEYESKFRRNGLPIYVLLAKK